MKRLFIKKGITALIFIIFLMFFSYQNIKISSGPLVSTLKEFDYSNLNFETIKDLINKIDSVINENVYKKNEYIGLNGLTQNLMGKNEESNFEVVKDTNGSLHYTYFAEGPNPVNEIVNEMNTLKINIKNKETKLIYLMPPDKYIKGYTEFPKGIPYNFANETADNFIKGIKDKGIDTIDFRDGLLDNGIPKEDLFFKTDHHWKIETSFWAYTKLVDELNYKYNLNLDEDGFYRNKDNYNFIKYKNSYAGSMARKASIYYSGVDDFTLIYPKFDTNFEFMSQTKDRIVNLQGRFEDSLVSTMPFNSQKSPYDLEKDMYSSYLTGNQGFTHIKNKNNPKGIKVLLIKDSFSLPLAAFLSNVCSDVYLVDPRYYDDDITDLTNKLNTDFVFVTFSPPDLTREFFNFKN